MPKFSQQSLFNSPNSRGGHEAHKRNCRVKQAETEWF